MILLRKIHIMLIDEIMITAKTYWLAQSAKPMYQLLLTISESFY